MRAPRRHAGPTRRSASSPTSGVDLWSLALTLGDVRLGVREQRDVRPAGRDERAVEQRDDQLARRRRV